MRDEWEQETSFEQDIAKALHLMAELSRNPDFDETRVDIARFNNLNKVDRPVGVDWYLNTLERFKGSVGVLNFFDQVFGTIDPRHPNTDDPIRKKIVEYRAALPRK